MRIITKRNSARYGKVGCDVARLSVARSGSVWLGAAGQGRLGEARPGRAGMAWQGMVRYGMAGQGRAGGVWQS